jgi:putative transposase
VRVVVDYIRTYAHRYGVEPIIEVLSEHGVPVAASTYYAHAARGFGPSAVELEEAYAAHELYLLWVKNRSLYGQHKLWKAARRAGIGGEHGRGRDQVARLMAVCGITGAVRGRHTTVTTESGRRGKEAAARHPDHINRAWNEATRPDQWWVADFTYVWTLAGFVYVSFVTDVFSRRILGWRVTTSKTTPLVLSALDQATFTRRRHGEQGGYQFTPDGLVHHSDAGSQYTSLAFTEALQDAGITGSIGSVGDALDNALMESTIGLYKTEVIDHHDRSWTSWRDVEAATANWVHWFNHDRLHTSIGDIPPVEYEDLDRQQTHCSSPGYSDPAVA